MESSDSDATEPYSFDEEEVRHSLNSTPDLDESFSLCSSSNINHPKESAPPDEIPESISFGTTEQLSELTLGFQSTQQFMKNLDNLEKSNKTGVSAQDTSAFDEEESQSLCNLGSSELSNPGKSSVSYGSFKKHGPPGKFFPQPSTSLIQFNGFTDISTTVKHCDEVESQSLCNLPPTPERAKEMCSTSNFSQTERFSELSLVFPSTQTFQENVSGGLSCCQSSSHSLQGTGTQTSNERGNPFEKQARKVPPLSQLLSKNDASSSVDDVAKKASPPSLDEVDFQETQIPGTQPGKTVLGQTPIARSIWNATQENCFTQKTQEFPPLSLDFVDTQAFKNGVSSKETSLSQSEDVQLPSCLRGSIFHRLSQELSPKKVTRPTSSTGEASSKSSIFSFLSGASSERDGPSSSCGFITPEKTDRNNVTAIKINVHSGQLPSTSVFQNETQVPRFLDETPSPDCLEGSIFERAENSLTSLSRKRKLFAPHSSVFDCDTKVTSSQEKAVIAQADSTIFDDETQIPATPPPNQHIFLEPTQLPNVNNDSNSVFLDVTQLPFAPPSRFSAKKKSGQSPGVSQVFLNETEVPGVSDFKTPGKLPRRIKKDENLQDLIFSAETQFVPPDPGVNDDNIFLQETQMPLLMAPESKKNVRPGGSPDDSTFMLETQLFPTALKTPGCADDVFMQDTQLPATQPTGDFRTPKRKDPSLSTPTSSSKKIQKLNDTIFQAETQVFPTAPSDSVFMQETQISSKFATQSPSSSTPTSLAKNIQKFNDTIFQAETQVLPTAPSDSVFMQETQISTKFATPSPSSSSPTSSAKKIQKLNDKIFQAETQVFPTAPSDSVFMQETQISSKFAARSPSSSTPTSSAEKIQKLNDTIFQAETQVFTSSSDSVFIQETQISSKFATPSRVPGRKFIELTTCSRNKAHKANDSIFLADTQLEPAGGDEIFLEATQFEVPSRETENPQNNLSSISDFDATQLNEEVLEMNQGQDPEFINDSQAPTQCHISESTQEMMSDSERPINVSSCDSLTIITSSDSTRPQVIDSFRVPEYDVRPDIDDSSQSSPSLIAYSSQVKESDDIPTQEELVALFEDDSPIENKATNSRPKEKVQPGCSKSLSPSLVISSDSDVDDFIMNSSDVEDGNAGGAKITYINSQGKLQTDTDSNTEEMPATPENQEPPVVEVQARCHNLNLRDLPQPNVVLVDIGHLVRAGNQLLHSEDSNDSSQSISLVSGESSQCAEAPSKLRGRPKRGPKKHNAPEPTPAVSRPKRSKKSTWKIAENESLERNKSMTVSLKRVTRANSQTNSSSGSETDSQRRTAGRAVSRSASSTSSSVSTCSRSLGSEISSCDSPIVTNDSTDCTPSSEEWQPSVMPSTSRTNERVTRSSKRKTKSNKSAEGGSSVGSRQRQKTPRSREKSSRICTPTEALLGSSSSVILTRAQRKLLETQKAPGSRKKKVRVIWSDDES